jgi:hypothetical protein
LFFAEISKCSRYRYTCNIENYFCDEKLIVR